MALGRRTSIAVCATLLLVLAVVGMCQLRSRPKVVHSIPDSQVRVALELIAPSGQPAVQARVVLAIGDARHEKRADADGRVQFGPLPRVASALATVTFAGAARANRQLALQAGDNRARIELLAAAPITGMVVDDADTPIPGAEIEAQADAGDPSVVTVSSDAQGRFELAELALGTYVLRVRSPRHELAVVPAQKAPAAEPVRIVLQRTSALRGEVLDASGKPAPGATVTIAGSGVWPPKELQSDAHGRFELRPVPSGVYELRARRATWVAPPREGVVIEPAADVSLTLRLEPGATLRGRVFDAASGTPLAKLAVNAIEDALSGAPLAMSTDADGRFAFDGLRAVPHRIWIYAPGYVPVAGEAREPGAVVQEFALRKAAVLAGTVVDEQGATMAGVELEVTGTTESGQAVRVSAPPAAGGGPPDPARRVLPPAGDNLGVIEGRVPKIPLFAGGAHGTQAADVQPAFLTDASGRFRIEGVPSGHVQIVARRAGYAPSRSGLRKVGDGGRAEDLRIVLARGATLLGRLVDARDYPMASVLVQLELEGEPAPRATVTGDDGRFRFEALRGRCTVTAHPAGGPTVRDSVVLGPGEQREVVLTTAAVSRELAGRVRDERGFPIASAQVRVQALDARHPVERGALSQPDGTFRVTGLPEPPYSVAVDHPDYAATRLTPVSPTQQNELTVELRAGARVFGLVLDRLENDGIAGARVRLRGAGETRSAQTDARGQFEFRNVSSGKYELIVDSDGHISGRSSLTVARSEATELEPIVLGPGGSLSGDVVDRLGVPVFDAEVSLGTAAQSKRTVRTDHEGHFRLTGIEPGDHAVSARHPQVGQSAQPAPVRVYPLQESPGIVLRLPGQLGQ